MPRFPVQPLVDLAAQVLASLGSRAADAHIVAEHLVESNLAGHDSHGLIRLPQYAAAIQDGQVHPTAEIEIVRETSTTALLDAHFAWGQVAVRQAMSLAVKKAKEHGMAAVGVRQAYHVGRIGVYLLEAVKEGLIGQAYCNGHGMRRAAPWGGTESRLATNPFAVAVPTRGAPIVADFATTTVAEGKVRLAQAKGEAIPDSWVMDADGRGTTDPSVLYNGGTLLPLGGREGHKGYCLSIAVDLLAGMLTGAGAGFLRMEYGNGVLLQVVDPSAFGELEEFYDRIDEYVAYLKDSRLRDGVEEIQLPGDPERKSTARRQREGIEVDADTWQKISDLAAVANLTLPTPLVD